MSNTKSTPDATTDDWWTPREITDALGPFDLDPSAPSHNHWTAPTCYTIDDDGLSKPWHGTVWLNPPYSAIDPWLKKLAMHGNGIALVFMRSDTGWMQRDGLTADLMLLHEGRIAFRRGGGSGRQKKAPAPSVFLAFGHHCAARLAHASLSGKLPGRLFREVNPTEALETYHPDDQALRARWGDRQLTEAELMALADQHVDGTEDAELEALVAKARAKSKKA